MEKLAFYICRNGMYRKNDVQTDISVFKSLPSKIPIGKNGDFEGPFSDLKTLRKTSLFWANLRSKKPKQAEMVLQEKNIKTLSTTIKVPKGKTFEMSFYNAFEHVLRGDYSNGFLTGVHFLDPLNIRIKKIYYENYKNVTLCDIERYDEEKQAWFLKKETTLFPYWWNHNRLFYELDSAFYHRFPLKGKEHCFGSITPSGIKVKFVIVNGVGKTIFPLLF